MRERNGVWLSTFAWALRVLAALVVLQLGGVVHAVVDFSAVVQDASGCEGHDDDSHCPPDGACDDCPDGCPSCHCGNAWRFVTPRETAAIVLDPATPLEAPSFERARPPPPRPPPSVYRPPRAA